MDYKVAIPDGVQTVTTSIDKEQQKMESVELEVTAIRLENFKSFEDSGWIEFNRITLLFGSNSAGKSTVFQALRMLKVAYEKMQGEILFSDIEGLTHICGSAKDIVYAKAEIKESTISFKMKATDNRREEVLVYKVHIGYSDTMDTVVYSDIEIGVNLMPLNEHYQNINTFFIRRRQGVDVPNKKEKYVRLVVAALIKFAQQLQYMMPARREPQREMLLTGAGADTVGNWGENTYEILYYLSVMEKQDVELINKWLEKFGYCYEWQMAEKNSGSFMLRNLKTNILTNIVDNGFGISQSLPVAVALAGMTTETLLVDSPEAHLQTNMQSELGDLLLTAAKTKGHLVVETGSEYLLLRLQRRVAEGKVLPESLTVYYVENDVKGPAKCHKMQMNEFGELTEKPKGFLDFFSTDFEDLRSIEEHKIKRMRG